MVNSSENTIAFSQYPERLAYPKTCNADQFQTTNIPWYLAYIDLKYTCPLSIYKIPMFHPSGANARVRTYPKRNRSKVL